eukprot:scaffold1803_cov261-Pinguiococcus_pyrenoidosus.AAC.3
MSDTKRSSAATAALWRTGAAAFGAGGAATVTLEGWMRLKRAVLETEKRGSGGTLILVSGNGGQNSSEALWMATDLNFSRDKSGAKNPPPARGESFPMALAHREFLSLCPPEIEIFRMEANGRDLLRFLAFRTPPVNYRPSAEKPARRWMFSKSDWKLIGSIQSPSSLPGTAPGICAVVGKDTALAGKRQKDANPTMETPQRRRALLPCICLAHRCRLLGTDLRSSRRWRKPACLGRHACPRASSL